nr:MAG TPA: hypothetical protein [Caudoviricetes sp.]
MSGLPGDLPQLSGRLLGNAIVIYIAYICATPYLSF